MDQDIREFCHLQNSQLNKNHLFLVFYFTSKTIPISRWFSHENLVMSIPAISLPSPASEASCEDPWWPRGVPDAHQEGEGSSLRRLHLGDTQEQPRGETPLGPARDRMKWTTLNNHPQAMPFLQGILWRMGHMKWTNIIKHQPRMIVKAVICRS